MRQLIPRFILDKYTAGETNGRFWAAALLVDISGFTALTEQLTAQGQHGAEVLAAIMQIVFEPMVQSVYEQGGFIVNFAGDAFLALFPGEEAPTNRCCLAAAWQMQQHMETAARQETPYGLFTFAAKVGVSAGDVTWVIVSGRERKRAAYYFRGPAVDSCMAAEDVAGEGEIILSPQVFRILESRITAVPIGDHFRLLAVNEAGPTPMKVTGSPVETAWSGPEIAHFVPQALLEQQVTGEFRQIAAMFIGFPAVQSDEIMAAVLEKVFELQAHYGGLFNQIEYRENCPQLLIYWGMPTSYENDVERALSFILALQKQIETPIKAGITFRIAHAGFTGSALREDYTCYGRGVNLAARFMIAAPPGEIWVDEGVVQSARSLFDLAFAGEENFKGFSHSQPVYILQERRERVESHYQGRLVGRQAELARLDEFIRPLSEGRPAGTMVIWGEAGAGKSRLVAEFLARLSKTMVQPPQYFYCPADQIVRQSLNPFRYWLQRYFKQKPGQSDAENKHRFEEQFEELAADTTQPALKQALQQSFPFLGALVSLRWPMSLYEQLDALGRYENSLESLKTLIQAESTRRPLLLHLEDGHWLDDDSVAFLNRLVQQSETTPLGILITARYESPHDFLSRLAADNRSFAGQEMEVGGLSRQELAGLAAGILMAPVSDSLLEVIVSRSGGNPFFAEQILYYLREQTWLSLDPAGNLELNGRPENPEPALSLPVDVRTLLAAQLDRLAAEVKDIVQRAAVLGQQFDIRLLAKMAGHIPDLAALIAQAEEAAIWSHLGEGEYLFRHALLRDTAYAMLLRARRQTLHRLAAEAIEQQFSADLLVQLAYHYEQAAAVPQALQYLALAGDQASESAAAREALNFYGRALALLSDHKTADPIYVQQHTALLLKSGRAHFDLNHYDQAFEMFTTALEMARQGEDQSGIALALNSLGDVAQQQGQYAQAGEYYQASLDIHRTTGDRPGQGICLNNLGDVAWRQGDYETAHQHYLESLAVCQQAGDRRGLAETLSSLGFWANQQGHYEDARQYYLESLAIRREIGDRRGEANSLYRLGVVGWVQGEYVEAESYIRQCLAIFKTIGDRRGEANSFNTLGIVAWRQGAYEAAQEHYRRSLALKREIGDRRGVAITLNNLGETAAELGHYEQARAYLQESLAMKRELGHIPSVASTLATVGYIALRQSEAEEARLYYREALSLALTMGLVPLILKILIAGAWLQVLDSQKETAVSPGVQTGLETAVHWLGFALNHPALDSEARNHIETLLVMLRTTLSEEAIRSGLEHGRGLEMELVVQAMLAGQKGQGQ